MKRPDYRTLQALDAVIRERGFERAAQKLCITQSAVSQRIKQLENMFGQPLLVRTVPPRPTEQGQKLLALLRQVELLEEEWLGDEQTGSYAAAAVAGGERRQSGDGCCRRWPMFCQTPYSSQPAGGR